MAKGNKNGWGAARDGKVHSEEGEYNHEAGQSGLSSKDLNGLYDKYQGKKGK